MPVSAAFSVVAEDRDSSFTPCCVYLWPKSRTEITNVSALPVRGIVPITKLERFVVYCQRARSSFYVTWIPPLRPFKFKELNCWLKNELIAVNHLQR